MRVLATGLLLAAVAIVQPRAAASIDGLVAAAVTPFLTPGAPAAPRQPVHMHYSDNFNFQEPPFDPTIVAGFDDVAEKKWKCIAEMPLTELPDVANITEGEWRKTRVKDTKEQGATNANKYRERLVALY